MLRCPMYDLKCTCPTTKSRIDELTQWSFCIRRFIHSFDHPVRANFGGLRHHLLDGASTAPLQGGEYVLVQHSSYTRIWTAVISYMKLHLYRKMFSGDLLLQDRPLLGLENAAEFQKERGQH